MPLIHFLNVRDGDCNVIEHSNGHITVIDVCNAAPVVMLDQPPAIQPEYQSFFNGLCGKPPVASTTPLKSSESILLSALLGAPAPKPMVAPRDQNSILLKAFLGASAPKAPVLPMRTPKLPGDFGQKDFPVNPIEYLKERDIKEVFRFVLTHPDMDHMDGIKEFFKEFKPANFWDTGNNKAIDWSKQGSGKFNESDWKFYLSLRDGGKGQTNPTRLTLHSDDRGKYYNIDEDGNPGGDGLYVLAPTPELIAGSNEKCENYHGCSYVILYKTNKHRIVFGGDSHDETWEHILAHHKADVTDVDVLIAPHHGRASNRSYDFLKVLNPALTLFGNAPSEHQAYGAFSSRKLPIITNNEVGCVLIDAGTDPMNVYVTNKTFAQRENQYTFASPLHKGYHFLQGVHRLKKLPPLPRI
jgi:competence protein ComEC